MSEPLPAEVEAAPARRAGPVPARSVKVSNAKLLPTEAPAGSRAQRFLSAENARSRSIHEKWTGSNEQWWDWYMSLADRGLEAGTRARVAVPPPPEPAVPATQAELDRMLAQPYVLPDDAVARFRREGFVKLKDVLPMAALAALRAEFRRLFAEAHLERAAMGFPSLEMMWTQAPVSRSFVLGRRLAGIARRLLGVDAVRLYHDNALAKMPGCGRTPWHYDAHHYPIDSVDVVTLWAPLQATPRAMGPLSFARGIDTWRAVADLPFDKFDPSYDRALHAAIEAAGVEVEDGPFELGEVSFHHTHCLHTAGPNRTDQPRDAFAVTYFADGARLVDNPTLISGNYEKFMPGVGPGDVIATPKNPVLDSVADDSKAGDAAADDAEDGGRP